MQRLFLLFLVGLFLIPVAADAATGKFICSTAHFVRLGGTELRETVYGFLNGNKKKPVTIKRLTIRNAFGNVVHDSGPAIGVPHPPNTDFVPDGDITVIAPLTAFYFKSTHIWDLNSVPGVDGDQQGFIMSSVVEFSTKGKLDLFGVSAMRRIRERIPGPSPSQGEERTTAGSNCIRIKG